MPHTVPVSPSRAALDRFDAELRASGSATLLLERWLAERGGVREGEAKVTARVRALDAPSVDEAIVHRLNILKRSEIRYRRVWLESGGRVLSVAENWYVPKRLGEDMAARLFDGDSPFGAVIAPLAPTRETLEVERLWDGRGQALPSAVLRHHALVRGQDGTPLCEVSEIYTRNILA